MSPAPARAGETPLRPARPRDLDRLAALYGLLAREHAGAGPRFALRGDAEVDAGLRDWLAARLRDAEAAVWVAEEVRVAEQNGDLPGWVVVRRSRRPAFFEETERLEVEALWVRPERRRAGLGQALVEAALSQLDPSGELRVELQVARANPAGRAFWEALGFAPVMDVLERRR